MIALILTGTVMVVITWALVEWSLWFHKWFDYQEAERKRPKQIPLDDALGTRNYNGPLG